MVGSGLSYFIVQWLFIKLLGGVYLIAFMSLLVQLDGLYGSRGILPIRDYVKLVEDVEAKSFTAPPNLFRLANSDSFLHLCGISGVLLSVLVILGILPPLSLLLLWSLYLSFFLTGQEFLSFQWDTLLLEVGFISFFFSLANPPPFLAILAYRFFLFRFIFSAGVVKLNSHDRSWRDLIALRYHYETQPIPNRVAWFAHQLPLPAQKFSTLGIFFFELGVPFLALGTESMRLSCFALTIFFQALIFLTGNYGFFNILSVVLAVPLLDDRYLAWVPALLPISPPAPANPVIAGFVTFVFAIFIVINLLQVLALFRRPYWLSWLLGRLSRWGISSPYGLFAVMTTERFEFVIEGSNDLEHWRPYEFKWKPGNPHLPPRQVAPHHPRLDWQMWFAALEPDYIEPWMQNFLRRLLDGSPPVLSLLRNNPFKEGPPTYIRLLVYRYHFSDQQSRRTTGRWWDRTLVGTFRPISLKRH